jgi:RNA polymerase sigma factor (sigma-70 family)
MGEMQQAIDFTTWLASERPRILRLCTWITGSPQAAEDLTQEALLAAWKNQQQISDPAKRKPWLSTVARNVCLNWLRKNYRERSGLVQSLDADGRSLPEDLYEPEIPDETNLELDFDQAELSRLLDQALALLPAETARLLVEHYLQESSQAEIAKKTGLKVGTIAVRLQRGKRSLRRLLSTQLQAEALAYGLMTQESVAWEETPIWCPTCGQRKLLGQFQKEQPEARFALRCPHCQPDPDRIMVGIDLTIPYYASLLGNTRTYKPAYSRLLVGLAPFYLKALTTRTAACLACGRPVVIHRSHGSKKPASSAREHSDIRIHCSTCDWATNTTHRGLVLALPDVQRFWRENPRIRTFPAVEIEHQGSLAYVTRLQSLTGAAELQVISLRETLAPIAVHTNIRF